MNYVYTAQTLIGDAVILYRCYAVWQSKLVMILPMLLWCAVLVTGFATPDTESHVVHQAVFDGCLSQWIVAFWASTLMTNLLTTLLLAYRVWHVSQKATSSFDHQSSQLRSILHVVIDAGAIYSFTLLAALICFVNRSNGQYVILDMITPIISITFYMVIIRVGLANRVYQLKNTTIGCTSTGAILTADRRSRIHVHRDIESHADNGQRLSMAQVTPMTVPNYRQSDIQFDDIAEVV
ncbi:hypothetical protein J3R83DRAFT_12542 [Lanmaoa asiatica]|nr:hypothetical protein J3R83DRAFT_12542 [Lanmaoa asiatica]